MRIRILKSPDKKFTPFVKRAAQFYLNYLIPSKRLRDNIILTIKFNEKLDVYALASIENYNKSKKAREFLIEIHPWIGAKSMFITLAHEMVHVRQYVKGDTNEMLSKWKGKPIDSDTIDYYHHPWEMEAYSMELGLFVKFAVKEQLWTVFSDISNPDLPIKKESIKWKNVINENRTSSNRQR